MGDAPSRYDAIDELLRALERARYEGDMEALVLADRQGLIVAGAGAVWTCEELAAQAPFLDPDGLPANDTLPNSLEALGTTRMVRVSVDGVELLMCGRGGSGQHGLLAAARSARRLLSTRRGPEGESSPVASALSSGLDSAPAP